MLDEVTQLKCHIAKGRVWVSRSLFSFMCQCSKILRNRGSLLLARSQSSQVFASLSTGTSVLWYFLGVCGLQIRFCTPQKIYKRKAPESTLAAGFDLSYWYCCRRCLTTTTTTTMMLTSAKSANGSLTTGPTGERTRTAWRCTCRLNFIILCKI